MSELRLTDLAKVSKCQSQELNPDWPDFTFCAFLLHYQVR